MEMLFGLGLMLLLPLVIWARHQLDTGRRRPAGDAGGADIIIDPASCGGHADCSGADGGGDAGGCGGGCGGCGS